MERLTPPLHAEKLQKVTAYVDEHIHERLPIARLAACVSLSPFHFARMFKRATGQPPHAYLLARRVERAKQLLRDDALPIVGVATRVGFQTQGHFTEVFRRFAGQTPRLFRLAAKGRAAPLP
jgi:transcriptional regulator GlxA family with amidase domain